MAMPYGKWATSRLSELSTSFGQSLATSGAWTASTFAVTMAYYETPFKLNVRLTFGGDIVCSTARCTWASARPGGRRSWGGRSSRTGTAGARQPGGFGVSRGIR